MLMTTGAYAQGLNDAQIASIVVTANQVDIDAGMIAEKMGQSADVKKFGAQMAKDHAGVNKSAVELVTNLKVTPEDNPTSMSLKKGGDDNVAGSKPRAITCNYFTTRPCFFISSAVASTIPSTRLRAPLGLVDSLVPDHSRRSLDRS